MAKVLGLDLGTNSIGWALIDDKNDKILGIGSRIFPEGVANLGDGKNEISKNAGRTDARGTRRQFFRRRLRKRFLLRLLAQNNLCPIEYSKVKVWNADEVFSDEKVVGWLRTNPYELRAKELGLTKHEVITLASIIEGEAIFDSERARISGVYHNRLKLKMKLQADPTIQYIISDSPRRLLNRDLRIDSPYNTYRYKGLPPGPINSPGKNSLIAALYPEENNYIFFVARGDGFHTFSTNERKHNIAKKHFQSIRNKYKKKKNNAKTKIK